MDDLDRRAKAGDERPQGCHARAKQSQFHGCLRPAVRYASTLLPSHASTSPAVVPNKAKSRTEAGDRRREDGTRRQGQVRETKPIRRPSTSGPSPRLRPSALSHSHLPREDAKQSQFAPFGVNPKYETRNPKRNQSTKRRMIQANPIRCRQTLLRMYAFTHRPFMPNKANLSGKTAMKAASDRPTGSDHPQSCPNEPTQSTAVPVRRNHKPSQDQPRCRLSAQLDSSENERAKQSVAAMATNMMPSPSCRDQPSAFDVTDKHVSIGRYADSSRILRAWPEYLPISTCAKLGACQPVVSHRSGYFVDTLSS